MTLSRNRWLRPWHLVLGMTLLLPLAAGGLYYGWQTVDAWQRTERRQHWLTEQEHAVHRRIQDGRPGPSPTYGGAWLGPDFALFDQGWVIWKVHSFHDDPGSGTTWEGLGDIAVMTAETGSTFYSRFHFCDGTVPWGLGVEPGSPPRQPRPANLGAFLALFKPGTWTADRKVVEPAVATISRPR